MSQIEDYDLRELADMNPTELKSYIEKLYNEKRKPTTFGYARVSTRGQAVYGNSLTEQREQLEHAGCDVIVEEQYTGKTTNRPKFDKLMKQLRKGDTLVVTKLDRFARTASEGGALIEQLLSKGIKVNVLNMGQIDDSPIGKVVTNVLLAFAQFERDMIIERTQAGRAIAMQRPDYQNGRPLKFDTIRRDHAIQLLLSGHSYTTVARETGISRSTLVRMMSKYRAEHA